jgi:hypothetical protein
MKRSRQCSYQAKLMRLLVATDTASAARLFFTASLTMPNLTRIGRSGRVGIGGLLHDCYCALRCPDNFQTGQDHTSRLFYFPLYLKRTDETFWKGLVVYFCERRRGPECVPWPSANLDPFSAMPRLLSGRLLPWQRRSGTRRHSDEEVAGELSGADRGSPARVFSSRRRGAGIAASCIKAWSTASKKSFINIGTPSGALD